jgi:hypothetical protein
MDRDILYLIGRGLIDHKERLYTCDQTGLTAEVAWPIMESILGYIRPFLKHTDPAETGLKILPLEPTTEMIRAALQASILLRQQYEDRDVQPDSPGWLPYEMVRTVWDAMLKTLPSPNAACENNCSTSLQDGPEAATARARAHSPVGYDDKLEEPRFENIRRVAESIRVAARWVFHFPKHTLVKQ